MNCCLQKYTTHQLTYFIYLFQASFKNANIIKNQEVHQKIHAKQYILFYLNHFHIGDSFEFNET